jgi:hypothetical protein
MVPGLNGSWLHLLKMDLGCNLAYQLVAASLSNMMNNFARVVSSLSDEAIVAL